MYLLYYAASHFRNSDRLREIATAHATTLLRTHLRPEPPVVASEDAYLAGLIKQNFTAQGYSDTSTWARGQAWGILGYAQTYIWTKDSKFLQASCGLVEYFLYRLETSPGRVEMNVPLWDLDAPIEDTANPTRDSSYGAIAPNRILVLSQGLASLGYDRLATRFRTASLDTMRGQANFALAPEKMEILRGSNGRVEGRDVSPGHTFVGLLKYRATNNNENALRWYANQGLVYGDYYFASG
ncbi:unsaturated glucuronyl hydrolase [Fusarium beomiforme]|uniref:Unsaturated glucuronyl hydrolase n=1 Tax=Fusarium beomiforme TaxID=44412 RepID=A0A9P5AFX4_9HYPO|nr:unsaturated glucuronyl hydrolase [Fusarium beomiforme]